MAHLWHGVYVGERLVFGSLHLVWGRVSLYCFCHAWYSRLSDFWANDWFLLFSLCLLPGAALILQLCTSTWVLGLERGWPGSAGLVLWPTKPSPWSSLSLLSYLKHLTQAMWYNGMSMECHVSDLWSGFSGYDYGGSDFPESLNMRYVSASEYLVAHGTWHVIDPFPMKFFVFVLALVPHTQRSNPKRTSSDDRIWELCSPPEKDIKWAGI